MDLSKDKILLWNHCKYHGTRILFVRFIEKSVVSSLSRVSGIEELCGCMRAAGKDILLRT